MLIHQLKIGTRYYDQTFFARSIRISSISSIITSTKPCFPFPFSSKKVLICSWKKSRWSSHVFPSVVHIPNFKRIVSDVIWNFRYYRQSIFSVLNFCEKMKKLLPVFPFWKNVPENMPGRPDSSFIAIASFIADHEFNTTKGFIPTIILNMSPYLFEILWKLRPRLFTSSSGK